MYMYISLVFVQKVIRVKENNFIDHGLRLEFPNRGADFKRKKIIASMRFFFHSGSGIARMVEW